MKIGEAERDHTVYELVDLLAGMGLAITPIELDLTDRQRLHPHVRGSDLAARRATGVA